MSTVTGYLPICARRRSDRENSPFEKAMAEILDIDFESERGETLEFLCVDANSRIDEFDHRWRQVPHPAPAMK